MSLALYANPFSSYCQKVLIALYENGTPFELRLLAPGHEREMEEHRAWWPLGKFPLLVDDGRAIPEATIIVEHLEIYHPGPVPLLPREREAALEVRTMDRLFDNYVMSPMQKIVADSIRSPEHRDRQGVEEARALLTAAYAWLDGVMKGREWAARGAFSLADCAAAPSLFYADWVHPIGASCRALRDYRARLLERPSFARAVDEARPYRVSFPPGAPDRD
jgi:glutathione S-transferase